MKSGWKTSWSLAFLIALSLVASSMPHTRATLTPNLGRYAAYGWQDQLSSKGPYVDMTQSTYTDITPSDVATLQGYADKPLLYRNLRAVYPNGSNRTDYQIFVDNNWLLRDADGNVVYSTVYGNDSYQCCDFGNSACQDWIANWITQKVNSYDFSGVMLDNSFGATIYDIWWSVSAMPMNPRTGSVWTDAEMRAALLQCHTKIKAAIGNKLLVSNGMNSGGRYADDPSNYDYMFANTAADGVMNEEIWYRTNGNWVSTTEWKNSVDAISNQTGVYGKFSVAVTYNDTLPTGCSNEQMFKFGLCSQLLAIQGSQTSYYAYTNYISYVQNMQNFGQYWFNQLNLLGSPISAYYNNQSVYMRAYENGLVLVNPSINSCSISLRGYNFANGTSADTFTIASHVGEILLSGSLFLTPTPSTTSMPTPETTPSPIPLPTNPPPALTPTPEAPTPSPTTLSPNQSNTQCVRQTWLDPVTTIALFFIIAATPTVMVALMRRRQTHALTAKATLLFSFLCF